MTQKRFLAGTWIKAVRTVILIFLMASFSCTGMRDQQKAENIKDEESSVDNARLKKVRIMPYWVPSSQFAGYYVGVNKGIFKKYGIDLEIIPYNSQLSAADEIRNRNIDFLPLWMVNAIDIREQGVDIVNIAQFSSRSSLMLLTKKKSGIEKIEDMNGKKAGIWIGFERQPMAFFRQFNIDVNLVPIGSSNSLFLNDAVEITNANYFDEYHSIMNNGLNEDELNRFMFADYGFNFLEDGIYCLRDLRSGDRELCTGFVNATIESWNYAFSNPVETIDIVMDYAKAQNQPVNKAHQEWMLNAYRKLYITGHDNEINTDLNRKDFEAVMSIMLNNGFVKNKTPFELFFIPVISSGTKQN